MGRCAAFRPRTVASAGAAIRRILAVARARDRFLVTGHARSDGDALGAQLAFNLILRRMGKKSHVVCDGGAARDYRFLPGSRLVGSGPEDLRPDYGAVFCFDSGSWDRLERLSAALPRERLTVVNVDHHASNRRYGDINWVDPSFSSCGEMVWEIAKAAGVKPDLGMATCVYTGIVTDTGRFSFSNTTVETHLRAAELIECGVRPADVHRWLFRERPREQIRFAAECLSRIRLAGEGRVGWLSISRRLVAKAGFAPADTQEYIDQVKSIKGVRVAVLLRETDVPGTVKVSFRTEPGIDAVALAARWGGGGHPRASGATFKGTLARAEREVIREVVGFLDGRRP